MMLIVLNAIAIMSRKSLRKLCVGLISRMLLSMTMLWIVFVFDISGVCSVFGIFEMILKLMNVVSTRIVILVSRFI